MMLHSSDNGYNKKNYKMKAKDPQKNMDATVTQKQLFWGSSPKSNFAELAHFSLDRVEFLQLCICLSFLSTYLII